MANAGNTRAFTDIGRTRGVIGARSRTCCWLVASGRGSGEATAVVVGSLRFLLFGFALVGEAFGSFWFVVDCGSGLRCSRRSFGAVGTRS